MTSMPTPFNPQPPGPWDERQSALLQLVPEAFKDGRVDASAVLAAFGLAAPEEGERFRFTWAGREDALRTLQAPSDAALAPDVDASVAFSDTGNVIIEGDNLEVLKLLHTSYFGQVKMVFIDPPYNTGKDFIYPDNFATPIRPYLELTGQLTPDGEATTTNQDTAGRLHSRWLSFMYPRLFVARQLLRDDGVICITIDDNEVHNLRELMNEVFGEENFIATVIWQKKYTRSNDATWFSATHDYILVYGKSRADVVLNAEPRTDEQKKAYRNPDDHPKGPWKATPLHAKSGRDRNFVHEFDNGIIWRPPPGTFSRFSHETLDRLERDDEIWFGREGMAQPARKTFLSGIKDGVTPVTIWTHEEAGHTHEANNELKDLGLAGVFDNPKPTRLIKRLLQLCTSASDGDGDGDIVLDFFAGSGTTGHAVVTLNAEDGGNRRYILTQLPELTGRSDYRTISDITAERMRRVEKTVSATSAAVDAGFRYFRLTPSNIRPAAPAGMVASQSAESYMLALSDDVDRLLPGWSPEGVMWEVILKEGRHLTARPTPAEQEATFAVLGAGQSTRLFINLSDAVDWPDLVDAVGLSGPDTFVCRDSALDDSAAANLALQCRLETI